MLLGAWFAKMSRVTSSLNVAVMDFKYYKQIDIIVFNCILAPYNGNNVRSSESVLNEWL